MKKIISLCVIGLAFASCSDSDDSIDPNEQVSIRLNSDVAVSRYLQETQIVAGQNLSLFVTLAGATSPIYYDNVSILADGEGGFTYPTPLYYPLGTSNVDFYAVNPYMSGAVLTTPIAFSVENDQSENGDYLNSDLLYASTKDVERTYNDVSLSFTHKLTKVTFVVQQSGIISLENLNEIQLQNVLTDVTLNLQTGALTQVDSEPATVVANNVRGTTETVQTDMAAIIVPQTFTAEEDKALIRINVEGNNFYYYPNSDITFESGKSYNYTITVYNTGITVTSEILPWGVQPDTEGAGTPGD